MFERSISCRLDLAIAPLWVSSTRSVGCGYCFVVETAALEGSVCEQPFPNFPKPEENNHGSQLYIKTSQMLLVAGGYSTPSMVSAMS